MHRVIESLQKREMLYLKKEEILPNDVSFNEGSMTTRATRNLITSVRLNPIIDKGSESLYSMRESMKSVSPKQIAADFHRKSHFKALEAVYLK